MNRFGFSSFGKVRTIFPSAWGIAELYSAVMEVGGRKYVKKHDINVRQSKEWTLVVGFFFFPSDQHQYGLSMFRKFFALEISVGFGQAGQADLSFRVLKLELWTLRKRTVGHFCGSNSRGASQRHLWYWYWWRHPKSSDISVSGRTCRSWGIQCSATVAATAHYFCDMVLAVIQPV